MEAVPSFRQLPSHCRVLSPLATDPSMSWFCQASWVHRCTSQHIACVPPAPRSTGGAAPKGLVVFLPGTALTPHDYSLLIEDFSLHGFYALGLFYPSGEGQNGCSASRMPQPTDLNCTALERQRVLTGHAALSNRTNVSAPDSIVNRIGKALAHLGGAWSRRWLVDGAASAPRWEAMTIAGHSNGADHAAMLAKTFRTRRALFFSGPNDYVGPSRYGRASTPAPWQFVTGATPAASMYGFGLCGELPNHGAMPECFDWRPAWQAQGLPGPWLKADIVLGNATAMKGYHRICSSGEHVTRGDLHMAAAADCCVPRRKGEPTRILWTDVVAHMLLDDNHEKEEEEEETVEKLFVDTRAAGRKAKYSESGAGDGCECAWSVV